MMENKNGWTTNLKDYLYHCGKFGHEMRMCDVNPKRQNFFGPWMRYEIREMSPIFLKYEKRWEMRCRIEI